MFAKMSVRSTILNFVIKLSTGVFVEKLFSHVIEFLYLLFFTQLYSPLNVCIP